MSTSLTFERLEIEITRTDGRRREVLQSDASLFLALIDQATSLGLPEKIAKRRSSTWLVAYIGHTPGLAATM